MKKKYSLIILLIAVSCVVLVVLARKEASYRKIKISAKIKDNQLIKKRVDQTKATGTYLVGTDVPEGEYVLVAVDAKKATTASGYYAIYQDTSKQNVLDFSKINVNKKALLQNELLAKSHVTLHDLNEYASDLVALKKDQLIELKNIKMYPASVREKCDTSKIIDGTYKVGRDIPEGTYTVASYNPSRDHLYNICIMTSVSPRKSSRRSLIANYQDWTNKVHPKEIAVEDGQYISFDELIFKKKD